MKRSEHAEQVAVIQWFDLQYTNLRGRLFAVPNGGHRHKAVAGKLKYEGVRPGVPDLWLPVPRQGFSGLVIEMKSQTGRVSDEQSGWLSFLAEQNFLACVCVGADAAILTISQYLRGGSDNASARP